MRILLLLAATLGLLGAGSADECVPSGPQPEVDAFGIYIDNDLCQLHCVASLWVYQESNGIDGLQRGDEVHDDTCGGVIRPDTLVARAI